MSAKPSPGISAADQDAAPLSISDRVVWLGSLGTRLGTVRWLGELPELRAGTTVGIELVRSMFVWLLCVCTACCGSFRWMQCLISCVAVLFLILSTISLHGFHRDCYQLTGAGLSQKDNCVMM